MWLYLLREPKKHFLKIGISGDVEKRRRSLITASGRELILIDAWHGTTETARGWEKRVHKKLKRHRARGEWFRCHPSKAEWIIERHVQNSTPRMLRPHVCQRCGERSEVCECPAFHRKWALAPRPAQ